ncbi:MAG: FixH family protein [Bdellovibrionia bacterium]
MLKKLTILFLFLTISPFAQAQDNGAARCDLQFSHRVCALISFPAAPQVNVDSPFQLSFTDTEGNPVEPQGLFVDLWMDMGHHSHGSAPVKIEQKSPYEFVVSNVYFVMRGLWAIRVTLADDNGTKETKSLMIRIQ